MGKHERRLAQTPLYAIALWERSNPKRFGPGYLAIGNTRVRVFEDRREAVRCMREEFASVPKSQKRVVKLIAE